MANPFKKAKPQQAGLKIAMYGLAGSGKTFTSLLLAEGIAKHTGKKIAYIDSEHGSDFYAMDVDARKMHPKAFDFDCIYTKSLTDVLDAVKKIDPAEYSILVIDSLTHIWEAAKNAYSGPETKVGTLPFYAWAKIKKPYKELINLLMNSPLHVILCGRQGNEFSEDENTGELKRIGTKMKAEGETPHEPNLLIHMEAVKNPKTKESIITAFAEKDRTGVLAQQTIIWPTFDNVVKPLLSLLGDIQAHIPGDEETSRQDAEILSAEEKAKIRESEALLAKYTARMQLCEALDDLKAIGKELTPEVKKTMTAGDVAALREAYLEREKVLK